MLNSIHETIMPLTVGILSLGCPKNLVDSEVLLGYLKEEGYSISFDVNSCDIALVNTCAFVEDALQESVDMIHHVCDLKDQGRIKHVLVCGCLPQRYPDGVEGMNERIDAYVGASEISRIGGIIKDVMAGDKPFAARKQLFLYSHTTPRVSLTPSFVRYIKIAEGCNNVCSFCVIPRLRGHYQSRPIESIVSEVESLAKTGLKEAILIGQDTSYYGKDLYKEFRLVELLKRVAAIPGVTWIRPLYLHPNHVTDQLIETMASEPKIVKYFDIPLQHINNGILKSMRRRMTKEDVVSLIQRVRKEIPGVIIRTTFIVGYPGEGEREFQELLAFVRDMEFDRLGTFMYSPEEGSHAATMKDTVDLETKKERLQDVMLLQQDIMKAKNKEMRGRVVKTLIEGIHPERTEYFVGRTAMDAPDIDGLVYIKKKEGIDIGSFYDVRIIDTFEYDIEGEIV